MATVKPIKVPGKWIPARWDPVKGYIRKKWQPAHYALPGGRWVTRPGARPTITGKPGIPDLPPGRGPTTDGGYGAVSYEELMRRANALADSQIAAKQAAIERQRAAAMAQAQRDAATYGALGQAQMGMISQIPANIQGIRNTAAQAMASTAGQISGAQVQQATAEQAANAAFTASQTGGTAQAAPDPMGVNAQGAAAAVEALGGTIPAQSQVETGAASAIAASGMPAVVARATQDQVAMRLSQAASQDADFRQQLIDAASERGGIYEDALSHMYDIESKKFGVEEARKRLEMDQQQFEWKKQQDKLAYNQWRQEMALKKRAQLAAEVMAKQKSKAQAAKEMRAWNLAQDRLGVQQGYLDLAKGKAGADYYVDAQGRTVPKGYHFNAQGELVAVSTKQPPGAGPNFYTDKQGRRVPKGYEYNKKGQLVSIKTGAKGGPSKSQSGPEIAASMASAARGTPRNEFNEILPPKKSWAAAYKSIYAALIARGYPKKKASAWAHQAVNSAYGPGVGGRPGKAPAEFAS